MKLEYVTGCICDSLTIDGKETINTPISNIKEAIFHIVNNCDDLSVLQELLITCVESMGEFEDLGHCDQCGDYITKYTCEI